jgi:hypothetical protein
VSALESKSGRNVVPLSALDEAGREAAWREIERELKVFEGPTGFEGPCELVVAVGTR